MLSLSDRAFVRAPLSLGKDVVFRYTAPPSVALSFGETPLSVSAAILRIRFISGPGLVNRCKWLPRYRKPIYSVGRDSEIKPVNYLNYNVACRHIA